MKQFAKQNRLKHVELKVNEINGTLYSDSKWNLLNTKAGDIDSLIKMRKSIFEGGRGKAISVNTGASVWNEAGGRCMYRGCGSDLSSTPLTTKKARIAYLAHIIASNPEGPRGSVADSHKLSDSSENIMLMCDAHHRLIDRIDVDGHCVESLQKMRSEHTNRVRELLNTLSYPRTQIITLLADLAQVPTNASKAELFLSCISRKLGPLESIKHLIRRTQRDKREIPGFWNNFLYEHETDIRDFIISVSNKPSQSSEHSPEVLAIFPLHLVPVLILAGRIVGEARKVDVFQYDRDRKSWQWDKNSDSQNKNIFSVSYELDKGSDVEEAVVSIELTAEIDRNAMPHNLQDKINNKEINWVRIKCDVPDFNCIQSDEDLKDFTNVARQAVQMVQDKWRSKSVHLFGVSPAITLFKFGQLLQAGHHPLYKLYDRPNRDSPFIEALEINGNEVFSSTTDGSEAHKVNLK